ncbi:MAG: hypothetical protein E6G56_02030 [Actinobacteria bacterium]|nr:MAG: hypothetical protein E6G56_02030 [Actinomycetota bacterium]
MPRASQSEAAGRFSALAGGAAADERGRVQRRLQGAGGVLGHERAAASPGGSGQRRGRGPRGQRGAQGGQRGGAGRAGDDARRPDRAQDDRQTPHGPHHAGTVPGAVEEYGGIGGQRDLCTPLGVPWCEPPIRVHRDGGITHAPNLRPPGGRFMPRAPRLGGSSAFLTEH